MIGLESRVDQLEMSYSWKGLDGLHKKLVDQNPYPVILCSTEGEIQYANKPALNQLGLSYTNNVFDLSFLSKENEMVRKEQNPIFRAILTGNSFTEEPVRIVTNNQISNHRLRIEVPESAESSCFIQLEKEEDDLKSSFLKSQEQNEKMRHFTTIVSHNLRSQAANILNLARTIDLIEEDQEKLNLLQYLKTPTESLIETLDNLKDLVTFENARHSAAFSSSLPKTLAKVLGSLEPQILQAKASIRHELDECCLEIQTVFLESILFNLVSNAVKYRSEGRPLTISIKSERLEDTLILTVEDNGRGIDLHKNGDKIFGLFNTFHQNTDATGIGLYLTKKQIESSGGRISVQSEPEKGTTFSLFFRCAGQPSPTLNKAS